MFKKIRIDREQVAQKVEAGRNWTFGLLVKTLVIGLVFLAGALYGALNATSAQASDSSDSCPQGPVGTTLYEDTSAIMFGEVVFREVVCAWVGGVVTETPLP